MAADIDRTLAACEAALSRPGKIDLVAPGFWRAVSAVKRDRALVERYADRIAGIDREAFLRRVPLRVPAELGVIFDVAGAMVGVVLMALASTSYEPGTAPFWAIPPLRELVFLAGFGAVVGTTHTLAHWIVGSIVGIRFTHWFSAPPRSPQPGFKTDYGRYLRVPARSRALMHAAGALVTKIVPFAVYPFALGAGLQPWAIWLIIGIGVAQLFTDALFSTRASDWKKFKREMRFAH